MKNPSYLYELQAREKTCVFLNFTPPLQNITEYYLKNCWQNITSPTKRKNAMNFS